HGQGHRQEGAMWRSLALAGAMSLLAIHAGAADWVVVKDDTYGFGMLMPQGTKTSGKDFGGGWGGGYAKYGVTEFFGIARLGVYSKPAEIEEFAIRASGVPGPSWTRARTTATAGSGTGATAPTATRRSCSPSSAQALAAAIASSCARRSRTSRAVRRPTRSGTTA